jgi:hypothetical protein
VALPAECVLLTQAQVGASQGGLVTALARQGAPNGAIRLQCDPPAIEQHLIQHLPEEFELDPRSFQYVLYVLELDDEPQVCGWLGRDACEALAFSVLHQAMTPIIAAPAGAVPSPAGTSAEVLANGDNQPAVSWQACSLLLQCHGGLTDWH